MRLKITSLIALYDILPQNEKMLMDVLRNIILDHLPTYCQEKLSFNVPFFYGNKGICILWPASIPGGGIKQGVLLGFWHGNKLVDTNHFLTKGNNKKVFYKIFQNVEDIDPEGIIAILNEAIIYDAIKK
jgi:hypothetical protein